MSTTTEISKNPEECAIADNPFLDSYWHEELKFLNLNPCYKSYGRVTISWCYLDGRCDDYLNHNYRVTGPNFPRMIIGNQLWMSITPMEVQSAYLAIHRAHGTVINGGLGLGYYALRAAAKPEVDRVIVYEREPDVISWFQRAYAERPELAKIEIIQGDATAVKGCQADLVFMDIYADPCPNSTLTHMRKFLKNNHVKRYHFWGWELALVHYLLSAELKRHRDQLFRFNGIGRDFFTWYGAWALTNNLNVCTLDEDYAKKAVNLFKSYFPL